MKTTFASTARLAIFAMLIAGVYSFTNVSYTIVSATNSDSIMKKGIAVTGAQEVPAASPAGSGTLDVSYNKSTKTLTYAATYTGMTDSVTMMHFHGPAEKGKNAGVVFPIQGFTPGTSGSVSGTVKLDEVKLKEADLLGGKWYFNVHTTTHPGGEIRGQVEF